MRTFCLGSRRSPDGEHLIAGGPAFHLLGRTPTVLLVSVRSAWGGSPECVRNGGCACGRSPFNVWEMSGLHKSYGQRVPHITLPAPPRNPGRRSSPAPL